MWVERRDPHSISQCAADHPTVRCDGKLIPVLRNIPVVGITKIEVAPRVIHHSGRRCLRPVPVCLVWTRCDWCTFSSQTLLSFMQIRRVAPQIGPQSTHFLDFAVYA